MNHALQPVCFSSVLSVFSVVKVLILVHVKDPKALIDAQACALVCRAHERIFAKLTKREQGAIAVMPKVKRKTSA